MDNASTHKTRLIGNWFARRPNWHQHFTPTSSSWIIQVERFFALLAEKQSFWLPSSASAAAPWTPMR